MFLRISYHKKEQANSHRNKRKVQTNLRTNVISQHFSHHSSDKKNLLCMKSTVFVTSMFGNLYGRSFRSIQDHRYFGQNPSWRSQSLEREKINGPGFLGKLAHKDYLACWSRSTYLLCKLTSYCRVTVSKTWKTWIFLKFTGLSFSPQKMSPANR